MAGKFKAMIAAGLTVATALGAGVSSAWAQDRQKDKNNMRNLGVVLGAGALHQAVKGKTTNAIVLGAGAAYAAKKYEDARKAQSKESNQYSRYENDAWRYSGGGGSTQNYPWSGSNDRYEYENNDGYRYAREKRVVSQRGRKDNGLHKGHYKNGKAYGYKAKKSKR